MVIAFVAVPFAYKDYDWISYENEVSVATKAKWVAKAGFGGLALYAVNYDDFTGNCGKPFALQKAISRTLELANIRTYREQLN